MSDKLMIRCEQKKLFKIEEKKEREWVEVDVSELISGSQVDIRCVHCHGRVRVYKQQVEHSPADHVEHMSRQDSEYCRGGQYFTGLHRMPPYPVE